MAQEKELTLDVGDDEKSGGSSKLVIILLLLVVLIGGGAAAAFFLMKGGDAEEEVAASDVILPSKYLKLTPAFIANYVVDKRKHYLQVEMTLVTRDPSKLTVFEDHMPLIQSDINMWLNQQDFAALRDPETRETLRQTLLENLQAKLEAETGDSALEDILFTGFVMQ